MDKKTLYAVIISIVFILGAFLFKDKETNAQLGITVFGGTITYVDYCCNGLAVTVTPTQGGAVTKNIPTVVNGVIVWVPTVISIGPSTGGTFFLGWNDIANPNVFYPLYNVWLAQGQATLGLAAGFATCIRIAGGCEDTYPVTGGTVMKIGTGL